MTRLTGMKFKWLEWLLNEITSIVIIIPFHLRNDGMMLEWRNEEEWSCFWRGEKKLNFEMPWNPADKTNPQTLERSPKHESPGDNVVSREPSKFVFGLHSKWKLCRGLRHSPKTPWKTFTINFTAQQLNYYIHKIIIWFMNKHLKK